MIRRGIPPTWFRIRTAIGWWSVHPSRLTEFHRRRCAGCSVLPGPRGVARVPPRSPGLRTANPARPTARLAARSGTQVQPPSGIAARAQPAPRGVLCYQVRAVWRGFHRGHPGCALQTQPGQQRGRHHQSSSGAPRGPANPGQRGQVPPDDRLTAILPPVTDDRSAPHADSIEAVKAALDGVTISRPAAPRAGRRIPASVVRFHPTTD